MTEKEVFIEIISNPKWYAGLLSPQSATNIKRRFLTSEVKPSTLKRIFNHFGYHLTSSWEKK